MKISFSTLGCPSWSLAEILDAAGRLGYDGVELRFIAGDDALWARPELSGAGLEETRARLRDAALAISCVDTRSFFHDPPGPARDRALDEAKRSLELAARLGASGIRVFGDRVQPGQDKGSTAALVADALQRLGESAEPLGVEVWLETHGDFARGRDGSRGRTDQPPAAVEGSTSPSTAGRLTRSACRSGFPDGNRSRKATRPSETPPRNGASWLRWRSRAGTT